MTKEIFHHVTAELINDEYGNAVILTQQDSMDESTVVIHPLQLRHLAERYAGMEPVGWMTSQPVKTLARRLRTLTFHIEVLYEYINNHSDHKHADLSFELVKVTALTEMANEFCADLPDEDGQHGDAPTPEPVTTSESKQIKGAGKNVQVSLI